MAVGLRLKDFQVAKFRDLPIFVTSESVSRGKKTVIHEYPNSDKRFVEELGKLPPTFTLNVIVFGSDAVQDRYNLEFKLEEPGLGTLIHPVYGSNEVQVLEYNAKSDQTKIGVFEYSIKFAISEATITPTPAEVTSSNVKNDAELAREAIFGSLVDKYIPPEMSDSIVGVADNVTGIYDTVEDNINNVTGTIISQMATFTRFITQGRDSVYQVIQTGQNVKDSLVDVYNSALAAVSDPSTLTAAWEELLSFNLDGSTTDFGPITTVTRTATGTSQNITDEHTRLMALINYTEALSFTEFSTMSSLEEARTKMVEHYDLFFRDGDKVTGDYGLDSMLNDPIVRGALNTLKITAIADFETKEQNAWRVLDVDGGISSLVLLNYQYYGSLDNIDTVLNLNTNINAANFVNEEVKIVQ